MSKEGSRKNQRKTFRRKPRTKPKASIREKNDNVKRSITIDLDTILAQTLELEYARVTINEFAISIRQAIKQARTKLASIS